MKIFVLNSAQQFQISIVGQFDDFLHNIFNNRFSSEWKRMEDKSIKYTHIWIGMHNNENIWQNEMMLTEIRI